MAVLQIQSLEPGYFYFDRTEAAKEGARLACDFALAKPFPHIVIDDLLEPAVMQRVANEFPGTSPRDVLETEYQHAKLNFIPDDIRSGFIRNLLSELTQSAAIAFIEAVTGIGHLIPDPYFTGAGLHETRPGGYLAVHADFSLSRQMRVQRRVNLIIYLNDNWPEEYGGHLELWDRKAQSCLKRVLPVIGRAVIFQTDLDCYHGHPHPLSCPNGRSRRSIAIYYYTAPEKGIMSLPRRGATYRSTGGGLMSAVRQDWRRKLTNVAVDLTPPIVYRALRDLAGRS